MSKLGIFHTKVFILSSIEIDSVKENKNVLIVILRYISKELFLYKYTILLCVSQKIISQGPSFDFSRKPKYQ